RPDSGDAFLPDPTDPTSRGGRGPRASDDAEWFAEEYIASATTGEPVAEDARDEIRDDEEGGPFLELDAQAELPDTHREPVPPGDVVKETEGPTRSGDFRSRQLRRPAPWCASTRRGQPAVAPPIRPARVSVPCGGHLLAWWS